MACPKSLASPTTFHSEAVGALNRVRRWFRTSLRVISGDLGSLRGNRPPAGDTEHLRRLTEPAGAVGTGIDGYKVERIPLTPEEQAEIEALRPRTPVERQGPGEEPPMRRGRSPGKRPGGLRERPKVLILGEGETEHEYFVGLRDHFKWSGRRASVSSGRGPEPVKIEITARTRADHYDDHPWADVHTVVDVVERQYERHAR